MNLKTVDVKVWMLENQLQHLKPMMPRYHMDTAGTRHGYMTMVQILHIKSEESNAI